MRFLFRKLMIVMAIGPIMLWIGWGKSQAWKAEQDRRRVPLLLRMPPAPFRPRTGSPLNVKPQIILDDNDPPLTLELPP